MGGEAVSFGFTLSDMLAGYGDEDVDIGVAYDSPVEGVVASNDGPSPSIKHGTGIPARPGERLRKRRRLRDVRDSTPDVQDAEAGSASDVVMSYGNDGGISPPPVPDNSKNWLRMVPATPLGDEDEEAKPKLLTFGGDSIEWLDAGEFLKQASGHGGGGEDGGDEESDDEEYEIPVISSVKITLLGDGSFSAPEVDGCTLKFKNGLFIGKGDLSGDPVALDSEIPDNTVECGDDHSQPTR